MENGAWKQVQQRHETFWHGERGVLLEQVTTYQPLGARRGIPLADGQLSSEGQRIVPDLIDPDRFYPTAHKPSSAWQGDFIGGAGPPGLCWTEAILGCPVLMVTGGAWAGPFEADWTAPAQLEPDLAWLEKLDAFVDLLVERAAGHYPIVQPLLRGPIDMMASAMGHEEMCLALMEYPDRADAFLAYCTDLFIHTAKRRLEHTPPFAGGYASGYGIWAPGTVVRTQVDNATMLSPTVYRERVLAHDRRVIEAFDYPLIHLHSGCLHIVDDLLAVEALKAVQVSLDFPGGPLATEVLPILEQIVRQKALIVTGPVTTEELHSLEALAQEGSLCLRVALIQDMEDYRPSGN